MPRRRALRARRPVIRPPAGVGRYRGLGCTAIGRAHSRKFEQWGMQRRMFSLGSPDFERPPSGLYVPADEGFLVASPAFCFLRPSEGMSVSQSVLLEFEMCGVFASNNALDDASGNASSSASGGAVRDVPLVSPSDLRRMADSLPGARGRKVAARAFRLVASRSASPMESALRAALALPYSLSGCSLPMPEPNHRIDIPSAQRPVFSEAHCLWDLYWPDPLACVEYDSDAFHTASCAIRRGVMRCSL